MYLSRNRCFSVDNKQLYILMQSKWELFYAWKVNSGFKMYRICIWIWYARSTFWQHGGIYILSRNLREKNPLTLWWIVLLIPNSSFIKTSHSRQCITLLHTEITFKSKGHIFFTSRLANMWGIIRNTLSSTPAAPGNTPPRGFHQLHVENTEWTCRCKIKIKHFHQNSLL